MSRELIRAIESGNIDEVRQFLSSGVDVNKSFYDGHTPLTLACENDNIDIVQRLLTSGANVNEEWIRDNYRERHTPLMVACMGRNIDIVQRLLTSGANVNKRNPFYQTALHIACEKGSIDIVRLLIEHGADINATTHDIEASPFEYRRCYGWTPLMFAVYAKHYDVAQYLISVLETRK